MNKSHNLGAIFLLLIVFVGCSNYPIDEQGVPSGPSIIYLETPTPTVNMITLESPEDGLEASVSQDLCKKVPAPSIDEKILSNIYMSGKFYLCSYDGTQNGFDFDSGRLISAESKLSDLKLVISSASIDNRTIYYLRENNGAFVDPSELSIPTMEYCEERMYAENRLTLVLGSVGMTGCILTNEGRLGFFQVEQEDPFGLESIEVTFVIWEKR